MCAASGCPLLDALVYVFIYSLRARVIAILSSLKFLSLRPVYEYIYCVADSDEMTAIDDADDVDEPTDLRPPPWTRAAAMCTKIRA